MKIAAVVALAIIIGTACSAHADSLQSDPVSESSRTVCKLSATPQVHQR
jgi:hypothetical protein